MLGWLDRALTDQLLIMMDSDTGAHRKLGFYKLKVLKVSRETDSFRHRIFRAPTKVLLCQVGGSGYVAGDELPGGELRSVPASRGSGSAATWLRDQ